VVGTFPEDSHPPIVYPAALLTGAADQADRDFFDALVVGRGGCHLRRTGLSRS
jgi:molybdate transport system substrate-binding protein